MPSDYTDYHKYEWSIPLPRLSLGSFVLRRTLPILLVCSLPLLALYFFFDTSDPNINPRIPQLVTLQVIFVCIAINIVLLFIRSTQTHQFQTYTINRQGIWIGKKHHTFSLVSSKQVLENINTVVDLAQKNNTFKPITFKIKGKSINLKYNSLDSLLKISKSLHYYLGSR